MEKYSALFFLARYLVGTSLLYYNVKKKKEETLMFSFKLSFVALSLILSTGYLTALITGSGHETRFYDVNFIDFVNVTLFANAVSKKRETSGTLKP